MTTIDFDVSMQRFVEAMATHEPDPDERAFCDTDPDTWLSAPVEREVQRLPVCFEHEAVADEHGVITCGRCGASEEEIVAEHEAQLEADIACGVEPKLDFGGDDDDESDSEQDDYARSVWVGDSEGF